MSFHNGFLSSYITWRMNKAYWWPQFRDIVSPHRHEQLITPVIMCYVCDNYDWVKVKVKGSRYRHADAKRERYSPYSFLTSALHRVSGQRHTWAALYRRWKTRGTHWIRDWVSLRAGVDTEARGKIRSFPGIEPRSSSLQSDATDWATPVPTRWLSANNYEQSGQNRAFYVR
jgi:hypothetical protein